MRCIKCGCENPSYAVVCEQCGEFLPKEDLTVCLMCGGLIRNEDAVEDTAGNAAEEAAEETE
ncbi:MAG: hypothetical protein J6Y67_08690 [Lachnospiraceae bacterium]|nr:hypothetical protein [Lachnospiraceae bacterium]